MQLDHARTGWTEHQGTLAAPGECPVQREAALPGSCGATAQAPPDVVLPPAVRQREARMVGFTADLRLLPVTDAQAHTRIREQQAGIRSGLDGSIADAPGGCADDVAVLERCGLTGSDLAPADL